MPNVPISGLPLTTSVCATALVPIVQNGVTCSTYACLLGGGGGGGAVTQITAGCGVTISPACGIGNVTICSSNVLPSCGSFTTCVSSPIVCGTTCVISPLVCGTTSLYTPTLVTSNACITALSTSGCGVCVGTGGLLTAYTSSGVAPLTSVGLTMPSLFCVCGSPLTCNGCICVSACGNASELMGGNGSFISAGSGITISGGQICSSVVGSVSCIVQGTGICITPACGIGAVTICTSGVFSIPMVSGCGICSILGNGCGNQSCGNYSFVGGGCNNSNNISACYSFIGGGICNCNKNIGNVIGGGVCNLICGCYGSIGGGCCNTVCNCICNSFIGGGSNNSIGYCNNSFTPCGCYNVIVGGAGNKINANPYGGIFTGYCNCNTESHPFFATGTADFAVTMGGCCNANTGCFSLILNGFKNKIDNQAGYNFHGTILNGCNNTICMACFGVILTGCCNLLSQNCSAILNGTQNNMGGCQSVLFNGFCNFSNGCKSSIFGDCNKICDSSTNAFTSINGRLSCDLSCGSFNNLSGFLNTICNCTGNECFINIFASGIIGTQSCTLYTYNLCNYGSFSANFKTFDIPHPNPLKSECGIRLKHTAIESPNAGDNIYRFNVTTSNCSASIDLPDYYKFLNNNDQVYVYPKKQLGYGYGKMDIEQTKVDICTNVDGEYNVLIIGTRKDESSMKYWSGTEAYS